MEWITKLLGLTISYYVWLGMRGKLQDGDMSIFLVLIGLFVASIYFSLH
jgi:hypothetical protein